MAKKKKKIPPPVALPDTEVAIRIPNNGALVRTATIVVKQGGVARLSACQFQTLGDITDHLHNLLEDVAALSGNVHSLPDDLVEVAPQVDTASPVNPITPPFDHAVYRRVAEMGEYSASKKCYYIPPTITLPGCAGVVKRVEFVLRNGQRMLKVTMQEPPGRCKGFFVDKANPWVVDYGLNFGEGFAREKVLQEVKKFAGYYCGHVLAIRRYLVEKGLPDESRPKPLDKAKQLVLL